MLQPAFNKQYMMVKILNQQKQAQTSKSQNCHQLDPNTTNNPVSHPVVEYLRGASCTIQDIVRFLAGIMRPYGPVIIAQETIANHSGIVRETANRKLQELHENNIIIKVNRGLRQKCEYYLNPDLEDPEVRWALADLFPSLMKTFSVMTLMPSFMQLPDCKDLINNFGVSSARSHYSKRPSYVNNPSPDSSKGIFEVPRASKLILRSVGVGIGGINPKSRGVPVESGKKFDVRRARGLNLTEAGAIKLSVYPPEAKTAAWEEFKKHHKPIGEPFKFYSSLCLKHCRANSYDISKADWAEMFRELEAKGFDKDAPGVQEDPYLYTPREAPKNGPYAPANPPERRGGSETREECEQKLRAAQDMFKDSGHISEFLGALMAGWAEGAAKKKGP